MRSLWSRISSSSRSGRSSRLDGRRLSPELLEDRRVLATFVPMGPSPLINGGTESVAPSNSVTGGIQSVVAHPADADTLYVGTVNGGIWRTTNATSSIPTWTPLTDSQSSLSIGDLEMDPNNSNRLLAGIGRTSGFGGQGGEPTGLLLSEDGGASWTPIRDPLFTNDNGEGLDFSAVYLNGDILLAASNGGFTADGNLAAGGLFRSTDGGQSWRSVDVILDDDGDPVRFNVFDLIADPRNPNRVYIAIQDVGVYTSTSAGASWNYITSSDLQVALATSPVDANADGIADFDMNGDPVTQDAEPGANDNMRFGISSTGRLFVGSMESSQIEHLAYTDDNGASWTQMDLPFTPDLENNRLVGLHPGAEGSVYFSLTVDPTDPDIVYIGGDRQGGDPNGNSIGARESVGRLFRGDVSQTALNLNFNPALGLPIDAANATQDDLEAFVSPQWAHLTNNRNVTFAPTGGTANRSAPHADSRGMTFDANGNLIEVDDGGIFRRTNPRTNQGDWFSLAGNLQIAELHSIAYDSNSNVLLAGMQDSGAIEQIVGGSNIWEPVAAPSLLDPLSGAGRFGGDGGDVLIDDVSTPGTSIRYSSDEFMRGFRRQGFNAANNQVSETVIGGLFVDPGDGNLVQLGEENLFFTTPLALNDLDATRILAATRIGLYELMDQGASFSLIAGPDPNIVTDDLQQNAVVFGGSRFGINNPALTYWGLGDEVLIRAEATGSQQLTATTFPGGTIVDLIADDNDWQQLFVLDENGVFFTNDLGTNWGNITGNLNSFDPGELRSIEFVQGFERSAVIVGANRGVYVTTTDALGTWERLGANLPNAPVFDMEYDAIDDVLAIGTLGRGAWIVRDVADEFTDRAVISTLSSSTVYGSVWGDADNSGFRSASERGVSGITVFSDVNGNGRRDRLEPATTTAADGSFVLPLFGAGAHSIFVEVPGGVAITNLIIDEAVDVFMSPGGSVFGLNFGLLTTGDGPGPGNPPDPGGPVFPGVVTATVFGDTDGDGSLGDGETGIAGIIVYVDINDNCAIGIGEPAGVSGPDGQVTIEDIPVGTYSVRTVPRAGFQDPACNGVEVSFDQLGNASLSPLLALANSSSIATDGSNFIAGANHVIREGFSLGPTVLADPDGDAVDEDGINFATGLHPGATETLNVTARQLAVSPGYLQGWIDFNQDGDFDDAGEQIIRNARVPNGASSLTFTVPSTARMGTTNALFRLGLGRDLGPTGLSNGGEAEDYVVTIPMAGTSGLQAVEDRRTVLEDSGDNIFSGTVATDPLLDLTANDQAAINGGPFTVVAVTQPANGSATVNSAGFVVYRPDDNFFGLDPFTYTIQDTTGERSTASVVMTVTGVNDAPVAVDDMLPAFTGLTTDLLVLDNDFDVDGDVLTVISTTNPMQGTATPRGDRVEYRPNDGFMGIDTFTYTITDPSGEEATATVTVTVGPPQPLVRIELIATDLSGIPLNGIGTNAEFLLSAFVTDLRPASEEEDRGVYAAFLDVDYAASLVDVIPFDATTAIDHGDIYNEFTTGDISMDGVIDEVGGLDGNDPLGSETRRLFTARVLAQQPGLLTFDANEAERNGSETLLYGRDTALLPAEIEFVDWTLEITSAGAVNDAVQVTEDTTALIDVLQNDLPDADDFTILSTSNPDKNGDVEIVRDPVLRDMIRYTPAPNFVGVETFTYTVRGGDGIETTALVVVTVINDDLNNDNPTAVDDMFSVRINTDGNLLPVLDNDSSAPDPGEVISVMFVEGQPISATTAQGGTVTIANNRQAIFYDPVTGFEGEDTFTYTISDGNGGMDTATVTVFVTADSTVDAVDDMPPPISAGSSNNVLNVLANDSSVLVNAVLQITSVTTPSQGGLAINNGTTIIYTPAAGFTGSETFNYTITDGSGTTDTATVTVTVVNQAATVLADDFFSVAAGSLSNQLNVLRNDALVAGNISLTFTQPANGTVTVGQNNLLVYTPDGSFGPDEFGVTDSFTYTITDSLGVQNTATVTIGIEDLMGYSFRFTDADGNQVNQATVGQTLTMEVLVWDLRALPTGVFSAYLDVLLTGINVNVSIADYGPLFPNAQDGTVGPLPPEILMPGRFVNEFGAADGLTSGVQEVPILLGTLTVTPTSAGELTVSGEFSDVPANQETLFDINGIIDNAMQGFASKSITVSANATLTNPMNPYDVDFSGEVSPLDALLVVNELGRDRGSRTATRTSFMTDVNADGQVSPLDALMVVNELDRQRTPGNLRLQQPPVPTPTLFGDSFPAPAQLDAAFAATSQPSDVVSNLLADRDEARPLPPAPSAGIMTATITSDATAGDDDEETIDLEETLLQLALSQQGEDS